MAIEIGKLIETDCIILISSAKKRSDIPCYYRIAGHLRLNRLLPRQFFKTVNPLTFWFFGAQSAREKESLREILRNTDGDFAKWAVDKILNWSNTSIPSNVIHIHGSSDKLLPLKTAHHKIHGGEHLMIMNRAEELSQLVIQILSHRGRASTKM